MCWCVCRTEDVSSVGGRLLSTEEQVTLITESMTVTSTDQEKLLLLNKNTELRRVNKEVQHQTKPVQILYTSTFDVGNYISFSWTTVGGVRKLLLSCEESSLMLHFSQLYNLCFLILIRCCFYKKTRENYSLK